jgi:DMSO reductase family type II enzyme chaperone
MNEANKTSTTESPLTRHITGREAEATAPLRCICYAALSELMASPHDFDPRATLREKIGAPKELEYGAPLDQLMTEFVDTDFEQLKLDFSGLFEVGNDGPPVPVREDLQTGQRSGTREDLVRIYKFFNYSLAEKFAWAPDHLSVQLEFMHFLCFREATADSEATSYQLAQFDFSERHLVNWVPKVVAGVDRSGSESIYRRVIDTLNNFLAADFAWQATTISTHDNHEGAL